MARSSCCIWLAGEQARAARRAADDAPAHEVTVVHSASRCTSGVPCTHAELRRLEWRVDRKRVERIMRERGIAGVTRRKRRGRPSGEEGGARRGPDRPRRRGRGPGPKPVGDIACLPTAEGRLYRVAWLDLATREIVGCPMADRHRALPVVDALTMAAGGGRLQPGYSAHSDRGSEHASDELHRETGRSGLPQSMGRTGSCFDDAAAESFFALREEEIGTRHWPDRATARAEIFAFIGTFYHRGRPRRHPARGCLTLLEIRQRHEQEHALAA
ncbi:hypothetical protein DIZ27_39210 [Streptomyces sp. NWU339]|uniref:IS3 family transposase n=1 Tax=Streptomyces sp. NWU339 TaxID=2185284 RepID=UPI000D673713|nr:IS3 family transposase [Streptomyces sp. NWU339]PWI05480.1 hypothetical protein DIZ27_39210 [Streptomyces sp. NWU339]